jgi:hypothetical protein
MDKYDPKEVENLVEYVKRVNQKRGELLNETINLENIIEDYIATHFCSDKNKIREFKTLIVWKMNFDRKINILKSIVNDHHKEWFQGKYPDFFTDVRKIQSLRNDLAHMSLPVNLKSGDNMKKQVVELTNTANQLKTITEKEIDKTISLAKMYVIAFNFQAVFAKHGKK